MATEDLTIPTVEQVRIMVREELKAVLRQELSAVPITMAVELVGLALGEIVAEGVTINRDIIWHICQQRLRAAFNNGLKAGS